MSEVTKLYENAGVKKVKDYYCPNCETKLEDWFGKHKEYICPNERCDYALCDDEEDFQECLEHLSYREKYPPFTAEKQIELIKWLIQKNFYDERIIRSNFEKTYFYCSYIDDYCESAYFEKFEEALANVFNYFWQDLTEEEKQQVKGILE